MSSISLYSYVIGLQFITASTSVKMVLNSFCIRYARQITYKQRFTLLISREFTIHHARYYGYAWRPKH